MRATARWFLLMVLTLDAAFAVLFIAGWVPTIGAEPVDATQVEDGEEGTSEWTRTSLNELGLQLRKRAEELALKETEFEELVRGAEVLRRAGLLPEQRTEDASPEQLSAAEQQEAKPEREAFTRLQRAYENMEPDTAAQALSQLAKRDKAAVVALILGWPPRTSGAILDALAQVNPALAADLSYEIWKMDGKNESGAAASGRPS